MSFKEVSYLPYGSNSSNGLMSSKNNCEQQIRAYEANIRSYTLRLSSLLPKDKAEILAQHPDLPRNIQLDFTRMQHDVMDYTASKDRNMLGYKREIAKLQDIEEKLQEKGPKTGTWTLERLNDVLKANSQYYVHNSIKIINNRPVWFEWELTNVPMTPSRNGFVNVKKPIIILPTTTVRFAPETCTINFPTPKESIRSQPDPFNGSVRAHPHVMSDLRPCLGDFAQAIASLAQQDDIANINNVIEVFLMQANSGDGAGKYWPNWLINHRNELKLNDYKQFNIQLENGDTARYEIRHTIYAEKDQRSTACWIHGAYGGAVNNEVTIQRCLEKLGEGWWSNIPMLKPSSSDAVAELRR